jgi:anthranilate synthase component 1
VTQLDKHSNHFQQADVKPSLSLVRELLSKRSSAVSHEANLIPLCASISGDLLTPSLAYLKISAATKSKYSFLFESAATTETIGRYSFVGTGMDAALIPKDRF